MLNALRVRAHIYGKTWKPESNKINTSILLINDGFAARCLGGLLQVVSHGRRSDWNTGGRMAGLNAVEAKNTFSYIVMQIIWCLKFRNMTKSGGQSPVLVR